MEDVTSQPTPDMETAAIPQPMLPQQGSLPYNQPSMSVPQMGPSPSDIENHAAAVHHSRLASALNAVGDILGGNQTLRMIKNADGSVDLQQVDSTPGEKWGRIAKAALSGAATGF